MENYSEEIKRLKEKINEKESLIKSLHSKSNSQPSLYVNYNKVQFDQYRALHQRNVSASILDQQLQEHTFARFLAEQQRQQEVQNRLANLKKLQEDQLRATLEQQFRAKSYKEDLDTQKYLKSCILTEEKVDRKSPVPKASESPALPQAKLNALVTPQMYFTKRQPKTLCFNPITGSLADTSNYLNGPFPAPTHFRQSDNLFLPNLKNREKVPTEFSSLKAFQQPKFTKAHPKFVQSFPITGGQFFS